MEAPDLRGRRPLCDLTRLLRARRQSFGTGVDRIDLALVRALIEAHGDDCGFVAEGALGPALLPAAFGSSFVAALDRRWSGEGGAPVPSGPPAHVRLQGLRRRSVADPAGRVYVNASHSGLPRRAGFLAQLDPDGAMERLIYIHDLIPIDYPEYQRPGTRNRFENFLREVTRGPTRFLANSADTAARLAVHVERSGGPRRDIEILMPSVSVCARKPASVRPDVARILSSDRPFFLCVGTIEARKNHLLLLTLWREMAGLEAPPLLVLAGRRGWESEMVVDMLERCAAIAPHVAEFGDLTDGEVSALMRRTAALLLPSFAEGLGVPLLEAAALGAPAIVSNLPALREIAPPDTLFLHPLDGLGWRDVILARVARTQQSTRSASVTDG